MNNDLLDYIYDATSKISNEIKNSFDDINFFINQIETNTDIDLNDVPFEWYSDSVDYYLDAIECTLRVAEREIKSIHRNLNKMVNDFE